MIIDPFNYQENVHSKNSENTVDVASLQKYLVDNFMNLLVSEDIVALKNKIRSYLYDSYSLTSDEEIEKISTEVLNRIFGYGLLQRYIENEEVSDIRVVAYNSVYVKIKGKWVKEDISFKNDEEFTEYIRYVALKNGKIINYDRPLLVFSDRKNNLRIEAGIAPVNVSSPSLVIRVHRNEIIKTLEVLKDEYSMLNDDVYKLLLDAVNSEKNIVISGKGGSGKTTLLKALIQKLPNTLAISTNEETAELNIPDKNVIQREVMLSRGMAEDIGLDTLTRHSLVSSNDAIIIGELKGKEASVFFDSISTGHLGYATVHSDCAENTIDRLITLVKRDPLSQQYKEEFIQKLLCKSIDYIIFMKNFKVNEIVEVNFLKTKVKFNTLYKEEVT